jgi:hypothetical protein
MGIGVLALALAAIIAVLAGCADEKDMTRPNLPPQTYVSLADSVRNTALYIQTIHWWGDDQDGEVVGYEYRWTSDPEQPGCGLPAEWTFTEETAKVFHLPVTDSIGSHSLEVRAVDDDGAVDETPATLGMPVTNNPPVVRIYDRGALPDTTFPALRIRWIGNDPDGDETIIGYRLWLDGNRQNARFFSPFDTTASFVPEDFEERYGMRTLSMVAIDSGCDTSATVTYTWYVKEATGDVLLVDDITSEYAGNSRSDEFYLQAMSSCVATYSELPLERYGGSVSYPHNFPELAKMFKTIVWYNDPLRPGTESLELMDDIYPSYVQTGGNFLVISLGAVGTGGALTDTVAFEVFGIDTLYMRGETSDFDCKRWVVYPNDGLGLDTLKVTGLYQGVECMKPAARATPLYHIPPGVAAADTVDYYLGTLNSYGEGTATLLTFPFSRSDYYDNAHNEFCKIIGLVLQ